MKCAEYCQRGGALNSFKQSFVIWSVVEPIKPAFMFDAWEYSIFNALLWAIFPAENGKKL